MEKPGCFVKNVVDFWLVWRTKQQCCTWFVTLSLSLYINIYMYVYVYGDRSHMYQQQPWWSIWLLVRVICSCLQGVLYDIYTFLLLWLCFVCSILHFNCWRRFNHCVFGPFYSSFLSYVYILLGDHVVRLCCFLFLLSFYLLGIELSFFFYKYFFPSDWMVQGKNTYSLQRGIVWKLGI